MDQAAMAHEETGSVIISRWFVDTRRMWPGAKIQNAAPQYLALIPPVERKRILDKYNVADARMSLASALLKRVYIAKVTGLPLSEIKFSNRGDMYGKPIWAPPESSPDETWPYIDFNVSHQAGLTTLVGIVVPNGISLSGGTERALVGCDIVAPRERLDADLIGIEEFGFEEFISAWAEMFSPVEISDIIHHTPPSTFLSSFTNTTMEAKLRRFYTYFCVKEGYIKLVGEGLLAEWIKECEFRNLQVPKPCSGEERWGEKFTTSKTGVESEEGKSGNELEIWLHGKQIRNVKTELQAFEEDFVITTMMSPSNLLGDEYEFPPWESIDLEKHVLTGRPPG
ncbi:4'-phosphopantetheinyl transferase [Tothia fuscella]|uniref:holo-[acyl-carrier-protein] synthase n=1 Tax=Tothia fuscella TaxID=1048955 RepID=A0A9P4U0I2_9PEZI|nr:4'-phosphopantetheinyl transferase [Tothia fuscella]